MHLFTQIHLVRRKGHSVVVVYYSRNGEKFRRPTGVKVLARHVTSKGGISASHPGYEEDMRAIKALQDRIEDLVLSYKEKYGEKPPVGWLERQFDKPLVEARKNLDDVLCYWKEFVADKELTLRNPGTIKRYNNLEGTLVRFKKKNNGNVSFDLLDQKFFNDFLSYMVNEHEYVRNTALSRSDAGSTLFKPETGLSNETAIKRLKDLTEYLRYCSVEHDIAVNLEKIKKYIKLAKHRQEVRPLSKTQKWELTLTTDEIGFVVNLEHHEPDFWHSLTENQRRYVDILLFMCLQGTAPIDTKAIRKTDIRNGRIVKQRSKSGNEFKVELDPIAEDILIRNKYDLAFTDQTLNSELKRIFVTVFELYRKRYEKEHGTPYEIICTQKMRKGGREVLKIQHKGLFLELMTGRRSFLTNLGEKADEFGIKELMSQAGHTVIGTTLGYIHERQQNKREGEGLFGIRKLGKAGS